MSRIDPNEVDAIVRRVKARFGEKLPPPPPSPSARAAAGSEARSQGGEGVFATVDEATEAAWEAYREYGRLGFSIRQAVIDSIRASMREHAERMGRMAHEETGLGRPQDKRL